MNYYNSIKEELVNNEIYKRVKDYSKNKSDLNTYYNVGKLLREAGKHYGEGIIKEYSVRLTSELGKKYSTRNLYNMRLFYTKTYNNPKLHSMCAKLTWSHFRYILNMSEEEIYYYLVIAYDNNLSVRQLRERIKNKEYERLDENTRNKFIGEEKIEVQDLIKNPILIKNNFNYTEISEKVLKELILEDLESFMNELGKGFSFIGTEYKIKIGNTYNYIDILLFNIEFNCYVVIELKITELKKEHIGQIETYMNYINKNLRSINQDKTIGIIICKHDNKFIMEYCSDERILSRKYELIK